VRQPFSRSVSAIPVSSPARRGPVLRRSRRTGLLRMPHLWCHRSSDYAFVLGERGDPLLHRMIPSVTSRAVVIGGGEMTAAEIRSSWRRSSRSS
jgi:hypothetical protein